MEGIRVREIRNCFRDVQALDGMSLDIDADRDLGTTVIPDSGSATVGATTWSKTLSPPAAR